MRSPAEPFDALVVGGGPAGATAAAALARRGRSVQVLEREQFPRFHVGESLLPLANEALAEAGLLEEVQRAGYATKRGATFEAADGSQRVRVDFETAPGVPTPTTWHVPRAHFDHLLLRGAETAGARVEQRAQVTHFELGPRGVEVTWRRDGREHRSRGRALLDASGRSGLVAHRLGLRRRDPELRKVAVFAHFRGARQLEGAARGDVHVVAREDGGWAWAIPLSAELTSVGFVFDLGRGTAELERDPGACLAQWIAQTPALARHLTGAERTGPARFEADFSYGARQFAGDGFALLGDAAAFLDPIFSTGVQLALRSGVEVAADLDRALTRGGPVKASAFARSCAEQRRRYARYRRLVVGFYRPAFRRLMFQPERWPAASRAFAAVLAGLDQLSLGTRLRVAAFHTLVALDERLEFIGHPAGAAPAPVQPSTP
jgi:FADH2-dependent halogenase